MLPDTKISRRSIVKALLTLGLSSVAAPYLNIFADDSSNLKLPKLKRISLNNLDITAFKELSKIVTLQRNLDDETVKNMYEVFISEPWGKEHIVGLYNKLINNLTAHQTAHNIKKEEFSDGEKWFTNHLLTTWYLGVYYHQDRPTKRITYEFALMYQTTNDLVPIPFTEATGFGNWAEPPTNEAL